MFSRKFQTNRQNALLSCGPKTSLGKQASSRNSRKHGLFAREILFLSEQEEREFRVLHDALCAEYRPAKQLEKHAVEQIAFCLWRCKLAARHETRCVAKLLATQEDSQQADALAEAPAKFNWYLSTRKDLARAIHCVELIIADFERGKHLDERWQEALDGMFGKGYFRWLTDWPTMSMSAILAAQHITKHAETFGLGPLPDQPVADANLIVDPLQQHRMVGKLLEQELQHLRGLSQSLSQKSAGLCAQGIPITDFSPRYFTIAMRDLQRAVDWLILVKQTKL